jgi:GNAT superfamily N-acetyltransferase
MSNKIIIRDTIIPGDLGAIIKLHGEYYAKYHNFDATFEPYVAIPLAECIQRKRDDERIWIVEDAGIFSGCIAITRHDEETAQIRWYILDTSVQGKGIGRQLIEKAIEFAKEKKYKKIILWTVNELTQAIKMYEKSGFKLVEEKQHFIWGKELKEQRYELIFKQMKDRERIYKMPFGMVYPLYIQKVERKGRTKEEVDTIIHWFTGYDRKDLQFHIENKTSFETFFNDAPRINPNSKKITGTICGIRVEEIEDSIIQKVRYLDKLIDELAKGKSLENILRK